MPSDRRDRSLRGTKTATASAVPSEPAECLARFVVERRPFQLVLCHINDPPEAAEVARFRLGALTIAVLQDCDLPQSASDIGDIVGKLTARELQIAAMVAKGAATKNIAHQLRISEWTVIEHVRRIFAKLNVDNRAAMVYRCSALLKGAAAASSNGIQ